MHHCQNRGNKKHKLSRKRKLHENMGEIYTFCGNRGKIYKFSGNRGNMQYASVGLGDGRLWLG